MPLQKGYDDALCLDPKEATTHGFADNIDLGEDLRLYIGIEYCLLDYADSADCKSEEELAEFLEQNTIILSWYATRTKMDFSKENDYLDHSVEFLGDDWIRQNKFIQRDT